MLKQLGSMYGGSSARYTSFFVGWQRKRRKVKRSSWDGWHTHSDIESETERGISLL